MKREELFEYCADAYGTAPDYPFDEDFETFLSLLRLLISSRI